MLKWADNHNFEDIIITRPKWQSSKLILKTEAPEFGFGLIFSEIFKCRILNLKKIKMTINFLKLAKIFVLSRYEHRIFYWAFLDCPNNNLKYLQGKSFKRSDQTLELILIIFRKYTEVKECRVFPDDAIWF